MDFVEQRIDSSFQVEQWSNARILYSSVVVFFMLDDRLRQKILLLFCCTFFAAAALQNAESIDMRAVVSRGKDYIELYWI